MPEAPKFDESRMLKACAAVQAEKKTKYLQDCAGIWRSLSDIAKPRQI
jgi:hypothetical protein